MHRFAFPKIRANRARSLAPYAGIARHASRMRIQHCTRVAFSADCEKLAPLKIATCIQRAQEESAHNTDTEMMEDERGDAIFVVAALDWCPRQAREPLDMLARMNTSLCIRHGRHARLLCSQPAGRQWSSHTMDIFDCTSRGQLHMVLVHAAVQ